MIFRTVGRVVALLRFVGGPQLAGRMLLVSTRDAIVRRRDSLGMRTAMRRFVLGALDLQLVGATLSPLLRRRLAIPVGLMRVGTGLRFPNCLGFPVSAMQPLAHLAEQRAEALALRFNWNVGLNLAENFQNLGVHAMHQLLVGGGADRVSNRARIRRAMRDYRYSADSEQRRAAVFRRVEPFAHRVEVFAH